MKVKSHLKPRDYSNNEVVRIVNPKQYTLYMKNGIYPIDVYSSLDDKTGRDISVMIFLKEETQTVFKQWCNYELE